MGEMDEPAFRGSGRYEALSRLNENGRASDYVVLQF